MRLIVIIFMIAFVAVTAQANSYLEMITTPPDERFSVRENVVPASQKMPVRSTARGDRQVKTSSPAISFSYPKSTVYKKNFMEYTHDELQHLVYMIEGGLLGLLAYEVYFRY